MSALHVESSRSLGDHIRSAAARVDLGADAMHDAVNAIMSGDVSPAQIAALLVALALKGETAAEIAGAAKAMRAHAVPVRTSRRDAIDVCGTGGYASGTFNISTAVAFVVAGAGVPVAKHGNRAMSSRCGSADVLETCGVRIDVAPGRCGEILDEHGITFIFAQAHHPAMRHVAPVRRQIGIRTLFNVLGPLTNPAGVPRQIVGVAHAGAHRAVAEALYRLGAERAAVLRGCDGLDEATLAGPTHVLEVCDGRVLEYEIAPEDADLDRGPTSALLGGDAADNAAIVRRVLGGAPGAHRDVVVLNAALALYIAGRAQSILDGAILARRAIDEGAALEKLDILIRETNR
ncbi:MAG TPA: anthranilate phosphoribosyltransferase [Candidatus Eremiobacteraceae bacterium]|nr:anthranilate phosphoribosyltransferase [Candidatus Eremiobacteraceae bacterium]